MSNCIEADIISPKHSSCVTISNATIITNTTTISVVATTGAVVTAPATITIVASISGNLCTLSIESRNAFEGNETDPLVVDCTNLSMITAPTHLTYVPIVIADCGLIEEGYVSIATDKTLAFHTRAHDYFRSGGVYSQIYRCTLTYTIS